MRPYRERHSHTAHGTLLEEHSITPVDTYAWLVLDGVYQTSADEGAPVFIEATAPSNEQLQTLLHKIIRRTLRLLTRLGHLIEEDGITYLARDVCLDAHEVMAPLQAATSTWRIAGGPRAGRNVLTLVGRGERSLVRRTHELCVNAHGFSLHAVVHCGANDRQGIEQLVRYITRPAVANERLSINREGNVVLKLKTPWRNSHSHRADTAAIHAAAGGLGAAPAAAPDTLSRRARAECEVALENCACARELSAR